ncbi:MAG: hypothetical protein JST69_09335 [Bacteroidetes bacterium]|nr:hypothetical protein [Bacteroidota bacterium]
MKNLQILILKSLITFSLTAFASFSFAQSGKIARADSLFKMKQYTQSAELYQSVFKEKIYTPAMLLKMAYIEEGLGKVGMTLYYLKLYYLASHDPQALIKMDELATKYNVSGYTLKEVDRLGLWYEHNKTTILFILIFFLLLSGMWAVYLHKKQQRVAVPAGLIIMLMAGVLVANNYELPPSVIVKKDYTYLMSSPSAGASVVAVISEGHQLKKMGLEDVWVKVKWMDQPAYVKADALLEAIL